MFGLNLCRQLLVTADEVQQVRALGTPARPLAGRLLRRLPAHPQSGRLGAHADV
jgi:inosine-uridine nucleoside N-ribohydrolase